MKNRNNINNNTAFAKLNNSDNISEMKSVSSRVSAIKGINYNNNSESKEKRRASDNNNNNNNNNNEEIIMDSELVGLTEEYNVLQSIITTKI